MSNGDRLLRQIAEDHQFEGLTQIFVGMLTDSRSFLSYSRHEYFRRILCNLLAMDVEKRLLPRDPDLLGDMVQDICYKNAAAYFGFDFKSQNTVNS
jgi:glucuronate isomerase